MNALPDAEPSPAPSSVHRIVNNEGRLAVEYVWQDDRFTHRILIDDVEVARGIDSDGEEDWPESPPIQQISVEPINDSMTVLGVGGAGRGHWSISVGRSPLQPSAIRFDIACRVKETPRFLGSSYRIGGPIAFEAVIGEAVGSEAVGGEDEGGSIQRVVQEQPLEGKMQDTYRWVYDVAVKTDSAS